MLVEISGRKFAKTISRVLASIIHAVIFFKILSSKRNDLVLFDSANSETAKIIAAIAINSNQGSSKPADGFAKKGQACNPKYANSILLC